VIIALGTALSTGHPTGSWERWNGSRWVRNPPEGYPGQNPGTGTVTILAGATVTINVPPQLLNPIGGLVVSTGTLQFDNTSGRVLTVGAGGVRIDPGGQFNAHQEHLKTMETIPYPYNSKGAAHFTNNGTINFRILDGAIL
jgi:adhesin HecA-like repeat protein